MRPWWRWTDRLIWFAAVAAVLVVAVGLATAPPAPADRVEEIASRIRCPVCQSVSVAESPSDQARDMRQIIAEQVAEGRSDEEIVAFFVDRYGEWIVLAPPPRGGTLALWLLPPAAILLGVILALGRRRRLPLSRRQGTSSL